MRPRPSSVLRATRGALLFAVLGGALAHAQETAPPQPTPEQRGAALRAGAARTRADLARRTARWSVIFRTRQGAQVEVEVVRAPFATRRLLRIQLADRPPREVLRVIEHEDGAAGSPSSWYVSETGGVRGIYRPREAPFLYPSAYRYLDAARLPLVEDPAALGGFHGAGAEGRWRFRRDLPGAQRRNLERLIASLEAMVRGRPGGEAPAQVPAQVKVRLVQARAALAEGLLSEVDPATGLLHAYGPPDLRARLVGFRWLDEPDLAAFVTEGETLPDRRAPLAGEVVLLAHCGIWRPGSQRAEVDLRWVSLTTGEVRRPPVALPLALPGCVLPARGEQPAGLLVTAPEAGGVGLFRVELPSGRTTRLGGRALERGACLRPAVSPDGRTVAFLHLADEAEAKAQVSLLDLAVPERVRLKGVPLVAGETLSWFSSGDALLLTRRVPFLPGEPPYASTVRLNLADGAMRELCRGESPVFVSGGQRILYRERAGTWSTCDLQGKDRLQVGDGLKDLSSPAPGPRGERVLMIEEHASGPRPVVVELETGARAPLKLQEPFQGGLWGLPVWR
ncbi:MAG: TolB family protein [Planctomycetota bacterium]